MIMRGLSCEVTLNMGWGPGNGQSHLQAWQPTGSESAEKAGEWNRLAEKSTDETMTTKPDTDRNTYISTTHTLPACHSSVLMRPAWTF